CWDSRVLSALSHSAPCRCPTGAFCQGRPRTLALAALATCRNLCSSESLRHLAGSQLKHSLSGPAYLPMRAPCWLIFTERNIKRVRDVKKKGTMRDDPFKAVVWGSTIALISAGVRKRLPPLP